MSHPPYRPQKSPRVGAPPRQPIQPHAINPQHIQAPAKSSNWMLWNAFGLIVIVGMVIIGWRLSHQQRFENAQRDAMALLATAEQMIADKRDDEAETTARKALDLLPNDPRCLEVLERIATKRDMITRNSETNANMFTAKAEELAITNIEAAITTLEDLRSEASLPEEAKHKASVRIEELRGKVCSLALPDGWPRDASIIIDDIPFKAKDNQITGITPGKHMVAIKREGFHQPAPSEMNFVGLKPLRMQSFEWREPGATIFVSSKPEGAHVWRNGIDTGLVTPCRIEDVDDGPVKLILKMQGCKDAELNGEVADRKPLILSAPMKR